MRHTEEVRRRMARLGGASHAVPLRKKGEQDMGDEGWLSRHGLYPWFLVISGVCLVVNLVDGMVLMSHGPLVGIGVLLVACVVADLWMAVRPRIGCWTVFLVLLAGTLSPVPFPASYLLSCLAAAGFLGYLGIMLGVAACVPGVLYAMLLAVLHHQEYRPGQGTPLSFALLCVIAALAGISLRLTRQRDTECIRRAAAGRNAQTARRLHDYTTNDLWTDSNTGKWALARPADRSVIWPRPHWSTPVRSSGRWNRRFPTTGSPVSRRISPVSLAASPRNSNEV